MDDSVYRAIKAPKMAPTLAKRRTVISLLKMLRIDDREEVLGTIMVFFSKEDLLKGTFIFSIIILLALYIQCSVLLE